MENFYKIFNSVYQPIWVVSDSSGSRLVSSLQPLGRVDGIPRILINFERKENKAFTSFKSGVRLYLVNENLDLGEVINRVKNGEHFEHNSVSVVLYADAINSFEGSTHDIVEYEIEEVLFPNEFSIPLQYRKTEILKGN